MKKRSIKNNHTDSKYSPLQLYLQLINYLEEHPIYFRPRGIIFCPTFLVTLVHQEGEICWISLSRSLMDLVALQKMFGEFPEIVVGC